MEGFGGPKFSNVTKSRRARPDSQFIIERQDTSSLSSAPSSENRNNYAPKIASLSSIEGVSSSRRIRKGEKYGDYIGLYGSGVDTKRIAESVLALPNWKSSSSWSVGGNSNILGENKLKKVKLKVGGVTRTFRLKASTMIENSGYESKNTSRKEPIIQIHIWIRYLQICLCKLQVPEQKVKTGVDIEYLAYGVQQRFGLKYGGRGFGDGEKAWIYVCLQRLG